VFFGIEIFIFSKINDVLITFVANGGRGSDFEF